MFTFSRVTYDKRNSLVRTATQAQEPGLPNEAFCEFPVLFSIEWDLKVQRNLVQ